MIHRIGSSTIATKSAAVLNPLVARTQTLFQSVIFVANSNNIPQRSMKVYTRTGDKGTSALFTGERRPKDDLIFEALGSVDELTSMLGLAREYCLDVEQLKHMELGSSNTYSGPTLVTQQLQHIQSRLQDVNSNVATPRTTANEARKQRTEFDTDNRFAIELESWIDRFDEDLPPLTKFILPSGGKAATTLHVCRTLCRRAERRIVPLVRDEICDQSCGIYLNRLSDYLFTAARWMCFQQVSEEVIYTKV